MPTVHNQLAVHIQRAVSLGTDRITIHLSPAELGRIDGRLELVENGRVSATVAVDRPETLDLLQRDSRGLERALQDAGLKADSGGLSFTLRDDGRRETGGRQPFETGGQAARNANQTTTAEPAVTVRTVYGNGALDIRV
jgi:flagellar hook-length control protein FliK